MLLVLDRMRSEPMLDENLARKQFAVVAEHGGVLFDSGDSHGIWTDPLKPSKGTRMEPKIVRIVVDDLVRGGTLRFYFWTDGKEEAPIEKIDRFRIFPFQETADENSDGILSNWGIPVDRYELKKVPGERTAYEVTADMSRFPHIPIGKYVLSHLGIADANGNWETYSWALEGLGAKSALPDVGTDLATPMFCVVDGSVVTNGCDESSEKGLNRPNPK